MTLRQRILRIIYPLVIIYSKIRGKNNLILKSPGVTEPGESFYRLSANTSGNKQISFETFRGKKVMVVNVASHCGYTQQYDALEKLYRQRKDDLIILGFPANDFNAQEKESDESIGQFCSLNFGVTFPLFKKHSVLQPDQQEVFRWLTDKQRNGWNNRTPQWNFSKYLIDEKGRLTHYFGPVISPLGNEIREALDKPLSS